MFGRDIVVLGDFCCLHVLYPKLCAILAIIYVIYHSMALFNINTCTDIVHNKHINISRVQCMHTYARNLDRSMPWCILPMMTIRTPTGFLLK